MKGIYHNTASVIIAGAAAGVAVVTGDLAYLDAAAGALFGIFAGPDQDQLTINKAEWAVVKYLPVGGWLWLALWDLYARAIPHRSPVSHFPIIGTAGRALYLAALWLLAAWWQQYDTALVLQIPPGFFVGWAVSDAAHFVMDLF